MKKLLIYCVAVLLIGSCTRETTETVGHTISIEINADSEVKVEGETVPIENLQEVLTRRLGAIEDSNIKRDSIVTTLRIDKQAQMGTITDLVKTMQALGLSRIDYTGVKPGRQ